MWVVWIRIFLTGLLFHVVNLEILWLHPHPPLKCPPLVHTHLLLNYFPFFKGLLQPLLYVVLDTYRRRYSGQMAMNKPAPELITFRV